jgi:DnaK suppressor protein
MRSTLEAERERLVSEIEEMERDSAENQSEASGENNYRDHMADQGSATFARELDMTLVDSTRQAFEEVEGALKRIEEGTYGTCTRCGAKIPESRLRAVPAAELCITCKELEETL